MLNKSTYVPPTLAVLFFNGQASFKHVSLRYIIVDYLFNITNTFIPQDGHNNCLIYIQNGKRVNISCSKG